MPIGNLLRKRRRVEPGVDEEIKRHWMAVDRDTKPSSSTAIPQTSSTGSTLARGDGTPIAVDGTEGDILTRLLDLNTEHARLQMLYDDLYARYERQKEDLANASNEIEDLAQAVEKRDARIKVLRMAIRRLKGKDSRPGMMMSQSLASVQQMQQFPEGGV